jgi:DNA-binding XRE family transcriptional regulator
MYSGTATAGDSFQDRDCLGETTTRNLIRWCPEPDYDRLGLRTIPNGPPGTIWRSPLAIRHQRGLTQEQFAELVGISVDFVSLIERGINAPSFETIEKLSERLDIEVSQLFIFGEARQRP